MSDSTYLGRQMRSFDTSPQFDGFSKVVIKVSDDMEYSAGTDTGRTLVIDNPWGTQDIADKLLGRIRGFQYQPYTATDAIIDPAADLGDAITVNNVYSGIYTRKTRFGTLLTATVGAPEDEELDHEFEFVSKKDRFITRNFKNLTTQLIVQDGKISAEVLAREESNRELSGRIDLTNESITAEVRAREESNQELSGRIDVNRKSITTEVALRKDGEKTLSTKIEQTVESIALEAQAREAGDSELSGRLDVSSQQIEAKVSKVGGIPASFGWILNDNSWTIVSKEYKEVLKATEEGLDVYGKITATGGTIGGFEIEKDYLSFNKQEWEGTNSIGAYIGTKGLQFGTNFKVDMQGNLYATSGTFEGEVNAGSIRFGEKGGTLSGSAITDGTIVGGKVADYGLSDLKFTQGVRDSLGHANFAHNVFSGTSTASWVSAHSGAFGALGLNGRDLSCSTIVVNGITHNVVKWAWP